MLAGCSGEVKQTPKARRDAKLGVVPSPRVIRDGEPVPKGGGRYHVGKPYVIGGRVYVPEENAAYKRVGLSSWYGDEFHGRLTANGEVFDRDTFTAAHPTLPLPSYVRVTNLDNGRAMTVRVNDRGPYHSNRMVDVSRRTAEALGFKHRGLARVQVEYVGRAPLHGRDEWLSATLTEHGRPLRPGATMVATAAPVSSGFTRAAARPFEPVARAPISVAALPSPVVSAALPPAPSAGEPAIPLMVPLPQPRPAGVSSPLAADVWPADPSLAPPRKAGSPMRLATYSPADTLLVRTPVVAPPPQPRR